MKKSLVIVALAAFIFAACTKSVAPKEVTDKFAQKFPNVEATWVKLADGNFEASFKMEEKEMKAIYAPDGNWLKTITVAKETDQPKVVEYMKLFYPEIKPSYCKVENADGEFFCACWKKDSLDCEAYFSPDQGLLAKDVNNIIIAKFNEKVPDNVAVWSKTEKGNFKGVYKVDTTEVTTYFDKDGNWLKTITPITEIPEAMTKYIKTLKGTEVNSFEKIESPEGTKYHACGIKNGVESCLFFDQDGKFMNTEDCMEKKTVCTDMKGGATK